MRFAVVAAIVASSLGASQALADPVPVRFPEGSLHGFLSLRGPDGKTLATGDLLQTVAAGRVTAKLVFTFRDGSVSEETAVYSQRGHFKLIADHLVQKGPAFPRPLDLAIDGSTGEVTVRYTNDHGEEKVESERMELPADLANGLITTLLKNLRAGPKTTLSMLAATPKPRLVKLKITSAGRDSLSIGGARRRAVHYVLKVDIGGIAGVVAPMVGKQPPDSHVWILQEEVPAFLRSQSPMFADGPLWQIDLIAPTWPSPR
jgi:hypothetical protein